MEKSRLDHLYSRVNELSYLKLECKYLETSRKCLRKKKSSSGGKLKSEGNFPSFGDHAINIQSRTRKKVNYKPKVKRPSLAESIGPIVVPQGESFRTQTSYDLKTIKNQ